MSCFFIMERRIDNMINPNYIKKQLIEQILDVAEDIELFLDNCEIEKFLILFDIGQLEIILKYIKKQRNNK